MQGKGRTNQVKMKNNMTKEFCDKPGCARELIKNERWGGGLSKDFVIFKSDEHYRMVFCQKHQEEFDEHIKKFFAKKHE